MRLDPKEVEALERVAKVINGLVIVVKEHGKIRQITSMEKSNKKTFQMVDNFNRKK